MIRQQRIDNPVHAWSNRHGFTLAEFAVAMVILGIALAIAVPNFQSSLNRARFDRVSSELQSDMRLAISSAKSSGRTVRFAFGDGGYTLMDATDSTVIRKRDYNGDVNLAATGNPLIFPWGLVQPTQVQVANSHKTQSFRILPTGRVEVEQQ